MNDYYKTETKVVTLQSEDYQKELQIKLTRKEIELAEITVRPTENPAHRIIKKVLENRLCQSMGISNGTIIKSSTRSEIKTFRVCSK